MAADFERLVSAEIARAAAERTCAMKMRLVVTAGAFGEEERKEIQRDPAGTVQERFAERKGSMPVIERR
jgi:hypothetical protein